jgi:hypothetical protein
MPAAEKGVESLYLAIGGAVFSLLLLLFALIVFFIRRKVRTHVAPLKNSGYLWN